MTATLDKKSDTLGMFSSTVCMIFSIIASSHFMLKVLCSIVTHHLNKEKLSWLIHIFGGGISTSTVLTTIQESLFTWIVKSRFISTLSPIFFIPNNRFKLIQYIPVTVMVVIPHINVRECEDESRRC